jgi:hypothetical protein
MTVEQFRAAQVIWGSFRLAAALGLALLQVVDGARPPVAVLASAGDLVIGGVLGRDRWLTRQVAQQSSDCSRSADDRRASGTP